MTTDNKTLAIDVLQWLGDERFMYEPGTASRVKCEEARAAVAELIEAAEKYHKARNIQQRVDSSARLVSAIARVKGESA